MSDPDGDRFDAGWLALREPADHAARALGAVERSLPRRRRTRGVDLGGGTGSNLRYLIPRLGGVQDWLLLDHDPVLLGAAPSAFERWAAAAGLRFDRRPDAIGVRGDGVDARIRLRPFDLAGFLRAAGAPGAGGRALDDLLAESGAEATNDLVPSGADRTVDLVTASALLDLVGGPWIDGVLDWCAARAADWLFALTFDGRIEWQPGLPDDDAMRASFMRDQRRDKGFGPALGAEAIDHLRRAASARGYRLSEARTDWRLSGAASLPMQDRLAADHAAVAAQGLACDASPQGLACAASPQSTATSGTAAAVRPSMPLDAARIDDWLERRRAALRAGCGSLVVGHQDLCGIRLA